MKQNEISTSLGAVLFQNSDKQSTYFEDFHGKHLLPSHCEVSHEAGDDIGYIQEEIIQVSITSQAMSC